MPVEYSNLDEATTRIVSPEHLSASEARALFRWIQPLHDHLPRIQMELAIQQIEAIERFNKASGKIASIAIVVALAQVIVGIIALVIAFHR